MTIGEQIKIKQPEVYVLLMSWIYVDKSEDKDKAFREIEKLMGHTAFKRIGRRIKQIRS